VDPQTIFAELLADYQGQPCAELGVLLALHRAVANLHQTHHWQASGPLFYQDHLLFERLYTTVNGFIDGLAEKAVGMGTANLVNAQTQSQQMDALIEYFCGQGANPLAISNHAEEACCALIDLSIQNLRTNNQLTDGIENMLQGICDTHEGLRYLLKQRLLENPNVAPTI
jgi:DNA-binding ferritin-like protein